MNSSSFASVVLRVGAFVRANISPAGAQFDDRWRRRVRQMNEHHLGRAFQRVLSCVPLRVIARLHRAIFRGHRHAVIAAGDMLRNRGLLSAMVLQHLFAEWEDFNALEELLASDSDTSSSSDSEEEEDRISLRSDNDEENESAAPATDGGDDASAPLATPPFEFVAVADSPLAAPRAATSSAEVARETSPERAHEPAAVSAESANVSPRISVSPRAASRSPGLPPLRSILRVTPRRRADPALDGPWPASPEDARIPSRPYYMLGSSARVLLREYREPCMQGLVQAANARYAGDDDEQAEENLPVPTVEELAARHRARLLLEFSRRTPTAAELENGYRPGGFVFCHQLPMDRRINEAVRRQENGEHTILDWAFATKDVQEYAYAVRHSPRAQEIRWLHNMLEDPDSLLYAEADLAGLLNNVREMLVPPPEA